MKTGLPVTLALAGALTLSCLVAEQAQAATYTYTGNTFSSIVNSTPPAGTYTTSMSVTGSFTLLNPLAGSLPVTNIAGVVQSFSFFDGRNTLTNLNTTFSNLFFVGTDVLGNITAWTISLVQNDPTYDHAVGSQSRSMFLTNLADQVDIVECISLIDIGCITQDDSGRIQTPGTWSSETTPNETPLPAALPLFATGLGALGLLGWRRKRKQVA